MPLTANFIADFSSFITACADATKSTAEVEAAGDRLAGSFNASVQSAAGSLQSVGSGIAEFGHKAWEVLSGPELREFGAAVTEFAMDFIKDFAKAEDATTRLTQSLKNAGNASPEIAAKYDEMSVALQKISTFSHVAITDAQAIFTTIGQVGPENMEKTLTAAMNLAAYMQTDVVSAAKLMQKAAESNGTAIGKLKVLLGDAYVKGMDFKDIVEAISRKFDGQFTAALDTTNGRLEHLKNQVDDVNEKIGKQMAGSLQSMLDAFQKLPEPIQTFLIASDQISTKSGPILSAFGNLAQVLGTLFPVALAGAGTAILEFIGGAAALLVSWPVVLIAALAIVTYEIHKHWDEIIPYLKGQWERFKQYMFVDQPNAFNSSVEAVAKWYYGMKYWLQDQFGALVDWIVKKIPEVTAAFKAAAEAIVLHSIVPDMVNGIADNFNKLQSVMVAPTVAAAGTVTKTFDQLMSSAASVMNFINPSMFAGISMPNFDARPLPLMFGGATSGLTENAPGTVITLNMNGMLGADDPQTRAQMTNLISNAVMQGMRNGRLLGTA